MLNAGDVVVDVGASVGHFSALAAKYVGEGGKVYSFEAALSPFDKLAKCVVGFPGGPIEIQNKAIWSASGELPFYVATNSGWSSLRQHPDPDKRTFDLKEQKQVSAITLDSIFQDKNIKQVRMLKLDVEGAEADVLIGGRDMLEANKVDSILMEYSTRGLEAFGKSGAEVHGMILNFGYSTVLEINSDRIRPFDVFPNFEEVITFDLFYVRSSLAEETRKMFFGNTKSN